MSIVNRVAIRLGVLIVLFFALTLMGPGLFLIGLLGSLFAVIFPSISMGGALTLGFILSFVIIFMIAVAISPPKRG